MLPALVELPAVVDDVADGVLFAIELGVEETSAFPDVVEGIMLEPLEINIEDVLVTGLDAIDVGPSIIKVVLDIVMSISSSTNSAIRPVAFWQELGNVVVDPDTNMTRAH